MRKEKFEIVKIDSKYVDFLRKFDSKVEINKKELGKENKPFIGILFSIDDKRYYAPFSSASKKAKLNIMYDKYLKIGISPIDIVFITDKNNKLLSVLNLNNMIPVSEKKYN